MMKLNILNMLTFLEAVNTCRGEVNRLCPDGKQQDISRQNALQNELLKEFKENNNYLQLTLEIPNPKDYMSIAYYYAGDC